MKKCMSCGKSMLLTTAFGSVELCRSCGSVIGVSEWKNRDFSSMDELSNKKTEVLQKAIAANISQSVVSEITKYFDEYINAGFVTTIEGKVGQSLKVFSEFCIITTKNEGKKEELVDAFLNFVDDDDDDDSDEPYDDKLFSTQDKLNIAKGLLSGRFVQTGVGAAVTAAAKKEQNEKIAETKAHRAERKKQNLRKNISRLITIGERKVYYKNIDFVETFTKSGIENGYLKFVKTNANPNALFDCEYFFFKYSVPFKSKKIRQNMESIKNVLTERIEVVKQTQKQKIEQTAELPKCRNSESSKMSRSNIDAFEEVRKYKQLLDEGIITEKEFDTKKKELLKL